MTTVRIGGQIGTLDASDAWQFAGPSTIVTVGPGQRLTGAAHVPLGVVSGSATDVRLDLCSQSTTGTPALVNFSVGSYAVVHVTPSRVAQAAASTTTRAPGQYRVGPCVWTKPVALDDNDFSSGFVQVTN